MMNQEAKTLATIIRHRDLLRANIGKIVDDLQNRATVHDVSKLADDEFEGFVRINQTAREHPYGSEEYKASLTSEQSPGGCIHTHYSRNSHHPEYHQSLADMGFMDIIEMVCDWKAAADGYGKTTLRAGLEHHKKRGFTAEQWWLIEQVVDYLDPPVQPRDTSFRVVDLVDVRNWEAFGGLANIVEIQDEESVLATGETKQVYNSDLIHPDDL